MAFNPSNLTVAFANPDRYTFDYTTTDTLSAVEANWPNPYFTHFNSNEVNFRQYDMIRVTASDGKAVYFITTNSPSLIKIADVSSFPVPMF